MRKCPECGENLSFDAMRCACGWGEKKLKPGEKVFDHRCTFKAGSDRCKYPVGLFIDGATSGWCIFHRQPSVGQGEGSEIVRQSYSVPYLEAIKSIQRRNTESADVRNRAHEIALRHGNKPWQDKP